MKKISTIQNIGIGIIKKIKKSLVNPYSPLGISWLNVRKLKNQPHNKLYSQKFLKGRIEFYDGVELLYGIHDIFINKIYDVSLRQNATIIDCGGHIGMSTIFFKNNYPDSKVIVFEPDERNLELLKRNLTAQGFKDVIIRKEAVWTQNTIITFYADGSMSSRIAKENDPNVTTVQATRLKDLLTAEIDFLKMDIEGAEFQVLKDIKSEFHLIKNLFIEYHGNFSQQNELIQILNWINDSGFTFYIKEAHNIYPRPFNPTSKHQTNFDVQLNIFCFRR